LPKSVPLPSIFLTTSIPDVTLPNTTCLPFSHGVSPTQMKNYHVGREAGRRSHEHKREKNKKSARRVSEASGALFGAEESTEGRTRMDLPVIRFQGLNVPGSRWCWVRLTGRRGRAFFASAKDSVQEKRARRKVGGEPQPGCGSPRRGKGVGRPHERLYSTYRWPC
jgi:hypothetical protein